MWNTAFKSREIFFLGGGDLNVRKSRKLKCCGNLKLRSDESEEKFTEIFVLFNVTHSIAYIVHTIYTSYHVKSALGLDRFQAL